MDKEERRVGGYLFGSEKDVELAKEEQAKIAYLESKMNYESPKSVLNAYNKIVRGRVFKTPLGFQYLGKLRDFLTENNLLSDCEAIPLYQVYSYEPAAEQPIRRPEKRVQTSKQREMRKMLRGSLILNIFLIILVIGMFIITLTGDTPTILNYERALQDKYAEWESDLSERENVIREKERELKIEIAE